MSKRNSVGQKFASNQSSSERERGFMMTSSQRYLLEPLVSGEEASIQERELSFVDGEKPAASLKMVAFLEPVRGYKNLSGFITFSLPSRKQLGSCGLGGGRSNKYERKTGELVVTDRRRLCG